MLTASLVPGSSKAFLALMAMVVVMHELILPPGSTLAMADLTWLTFLGGQPQAEP